MKLWYSKLIEEITESYVIGLDLDHVSFEPYMLEHYVSGNNVAKFYKNLISKDDNSMVGIISLATSASFIKLDAIVEMRVEIKYIVSKFS